MQNINLGHVGSANVFTLGPQGTSSEAAASHLIGYMRQYSLCDEGSVWLSESYEGALDRLLVSSDGLLLVANAYAHVNDFYMDSRLNLAAAFVFDTPCMASPARRKLPCPATW